jgi:hypothetical protein
LARASNKTKYNTYEDIVYETKNKTKFIEEYFGRIAYDDTLTEAYTVMYNKYGYYKDCLKTNLRLHLIKILQKGGFVVSYIKDIVARKNVKMTDETAEHRDAIYVYDNPKVKAWTIKYIGPKDYEDDKFMYKILDIHQKRDVKWLHTIKYYLSMYHRSKSQLLPSKNPFDDYDAEEVALNTPDNRGILDIFSSNAKFRVQCENTFSPDKVISLTTQLYYLELYKYELKYRCDPESGIYELRGVLGDKAKFRNVMANVFNKKYLSATSEGYDLTKDFYGMISTVFKPLYHKRQVGKSRKMEYYYKDVEKLLPIVEKMIDHKDFDIDILLKHLNNKKN